MVSVRSAGHFLLTHLLLDKLKLSAPSRLLHVTDSVFTNAYINFDNLNFTEKYKPRIAYSSSKLALVMMNMRLADVLQGKAVTGHQSFN